MVVDSTVVSEVVVVEAMVVSGAVFLEPMVEAVLGTDIAMEDVVLSESTLEASEAGVEMCGGRSDSLSSCGMDCGRFRIFGCLRSCGGHRCYGDDCVHFRF